MSVRASISQLVSWWQIIERIFRHCSCIFIDTILTMLLLMTCLIFIWSNNLENFLSCWCWIISIFFFFLPLPRAKLNQNLSFFLKWYHYHGIVNLNLTHAFCLEGLKFLKIMKNRCFVNACQLTIVQKFRGLRLHAISLNSDLWPDLFC